MNERERLIASLRLEPVDRVPVVSHLQAATVDLMEATGCYWPEANRDARQMLILALAANRIAGLESVKVPFDVALDPTAFGVLTGNDSLDRPRRSCGRSSHRRRTSRHWTYRTRGGTAALRWCWKRSARLAAWD